MKVLLIRPPVSLAVARGFYAFLHLEPLDLETVAAGIDRKHETRILDLTLSKHPDQEMSALLRSFGPDLVGLTAYSNQASNVKRLAKLVKEILPKALVIVGGVHPTIVPEDCYLPGVIDLVVRGEGATAMQELMPRLESGAGFPEGGAFLPVSSPRYHEWAQEGPPELPEYSRVPHPRRDLVDRSRYTCIWSGKPREKLKSVFPRVATMRTSVGCPHRCNFCVVHFLAHGKYLQRDPEDVVAEIAEIPEDHIYFVDDEMFINRPRVERIARLLIERGIRKQYISWARSDTICKNPELFRLWKEAGLVLVYVGLESMREETLEDYHKGTSTALNKQAVQILKDLGIGLHAALMVNPDFEAEDFIRLRGVIDSLVPAEVTFTVFSPPPGTELWEKHKKDFICQDPYAFYDCFHTLLPTKLPLKKFYRYFSLLYLFAFRKNPWRMNKVKAPWKDIAKLFVAGSMCGWRLNTIYKDYDKSLW